MTVTISFAESVDGGVFSHTTSYSAAREGLGTLEVTTGSLGFITIGQDFPFGSFSPERYVVNEAFLSFPYTVASTDRVVGAYIQLVSTDVMGTGIARDLYFSPYDWGASLDTGDFRSMAPSYTQYMIQRNAHQLVDDQIMRGGSLDLMAALSGSGTLRVFGYSSRSYFGSTPTADETNGIYPSEASGTTNDPRLVYLTAPRSTLFGALGAQCQLSDGSTVYVEIPDSLASPYGNLKHRTTAGVVTTIATGLLSTLLDLRTVYGAQDLALVRDASDNLYLIRAEGVNLRAEAYTKGIGASWTRQTSLVDTPPAYDAARAVNNNVAAAWHSVGGTAGTIATFVMRTAGTGHATFQAYALLNCNSLLAGSGSLFRGSGDADPDVLLTQSVADATVYQNETGTGLDAAPAAGTTDSGFVATYDRVGTVTYARYRLNGTGTGINSSASTGTAKSRDAATTATHDGDSKLRVLPINSTTFAHVAGDRITIQANTSGTSFSTVAAASLSSTGLATFPSATTLRGTAAWDAVYDSSAQKLWFYYLSSANNRRLMRTGFNVVTGLPTGEEQEVNASVGATGGTNVAIRVARSTVVGYQILVAVANRSAGGTLTTQYVTDSLNVPPSAPTLTPKSNFSATTSALFAWTFNDPNPGDAQSAYQIQINTSAGVSAINTSFVSSSAGNYTLAASALTNPGNWQWRVRTKDVAGEIGAWSDFGTFSTAAGGIVTITDPASDNPAGVITDDYTVSWSVSGTTQAAYRVKLVRTDTSATVSDTGFVTSVATSAVISGMVTDVQHRIEVTVRNASLVESATGTRLITPSYGTPEQPTIVVAPNAAGGYTLITVTNPTPSGDRPNVSTNTILRRVADSSDAYTVLGSTGPNGSFKDYTAAGGVTYEYLARGTAV